MTPAGYHLAPRAVADLRAILRHTRRQFGTGQHAAYATLILTAVRLLAEHPARTGSVDRNDVGAGFRAFPVWLAARRRGASPHLLFYEVSGDEIRILRILHQSMDPAQHLAPDNEA